MNELMKNWTILAVDDEPVNLKVLQHILKDTFGLVFARDGETALTAAEKHQPDLILLDIMMPEMDGYEVCRRLKANPVTCKIPVIFVTALSNDEDESKGFAMGGVDYITKPVSAPIVIARAKTQLALHDQQRTCEATVHHRTAELEESHRSAIYMLGEAGHFNDSDTGVHIWRMAAYAKAIAKEAGWPVELSEMLEMAAPMHDTGKIGIPDAILKKPAQLDANEWATMKTHTTIGHSILSKSEAPLFKMAADIAHAHHEKWDGSGYPKGQKGTTIPESARIVAIADIFDALTMRRPYKEAWTTEASLAEIKNSSDSHLDPEMVGLFMSIEEEIRDIKKLWDQREAKQKQ